MYQVKELDETVKTALKAEWDEISAKFADEDTIEMANYDTCRSIESNRYTHAVIHSETQEYVALIGIIEAKRINCHKVLDLRLNPKSNPDYKDELEIGMLDVAEDIVGAIIALTSNALIIQHVPQVKVFARGQEMKLIFKLVEETVNKSPLTSARVFNQGGWLVIEAKQ